MTKEEEPNWLGTLWNVDQFLAKQAEKYLQDQKQKEAEFLNSIAVENEKKNARIRELEDNVKDLEFIISRWEDKWKQLLNQKT